MSSRANTDASYYVCFIDLMGQQAFFKKISSDKPDDETMAHITRVSDGLREIVRYVKGRYERNFTEADDVGVELFSDSVLLSLRGNEWSDVKLQTWLDIVVKVIYIACRYKLPFRGGMAFGSAGRSSGGSIYGSVVDEAMQIEAARADYSRVVLSHRQVARFMRVPALNAYFDVDADSSYVLNYAGENILARPEFSREGDTLPTIIDWVESCFRQYCFTGDEAHDDDADPKLARRYAQWLEYLRIALMRRYHYV